MALKIGKKAEANSELKWVAFDEDTRILLAGTNNTEYQVARERHNRRTSKNDAAFLNGAIGVFEGELTNLQSCALLLSQYIIKNWEGVEDENGNEVEFSIEAASSLIESNVEFLLFVLKEGAAIAGENEAELADTVKKPSTGTSGRKTGQARKSARSSTKA